jgi:hypothetical protein
MGRGSGEGCDRDGGHGRVRGVTVELTAHAGDRIGWWLVTGPQPEDEVYGQVELSREYHDAEMHSDFFWWGLFVRGAAMFNDERRPLLMEREGRSQTLAGALAALAEVWPR